MTQVVSYAARPPLARRVNFRMLTIIAVFAALVGYPVYTFIQASLNHGIQTVAGGGKLVDLKAMGNFPFDGHNGTIGDIPQVYRDLDGKQVSVDGYVYAGSDASDKINHFQFVYNVNKCCFGGPPQVQERVFAIVPNHGVIYNPGMYTMMRLTGTMHVKVIKDDVGNISSVYTMAVSDIRPLS
jgi:hypothetical protein